MNREDIIRMAREAGWSGLYTTYNEPTGEADWKMVKESLTVPVTMEQIERFAALAFAAGAAAEREACAKVVEDYCGAWDDGGYALATAIRARGQQ